MYTNKSKFKVRKGYGMFILPKPLLNYLGWKHGDLISFSLINDAKVLHLERISDSADNQLDYNKEFCKKIAKFGGNTGSMGFKTFPKPILDELKPKNNQAIYFLPAKDSWLAELEGYKDLLNRIVFASFDETSLRRYTPTAKPEDLEKRQKEYFAKKYNLPFFKGKLELSDKNTPRAKNRIATANKTIHKNTLIGIKSEIKRIEGYLKKVSKDKHWRKEEILLELEKSLKNLKTSLMKLEKKPSKIFDEWKEDKQKGGLAKKI